MLGAQDGFVLLRFVGLGTLASSEPAVLLLPRLGLGGGGAPEATKTQAVVFGTVNATTTALAVLAAVTDFAFPRNYPAILGAGVAAVAEDAAAAGTGEAVNQSANCTRFHFRFQNQLVQNSLALPDNIIIFLLL